MLTPYQTFSRSQWREYRHDTPLTLSEKELDELRGFNESVSMAEVEDIYLPLSRLLSMYVTESKSLYTTTNRFLGQKPGKVPYIIGISGSVAVGKSTTSRILQTLLSRWSDHPNVALVTTDGFLYPNAELQRLNLMEKKGFPQSYDRTALIKFLTQMKSGEAQASIPCYSHEIYDITGEQQKINRPDILLVEGLNILQAAKSNEPNQVYVSDFIDFSIFVDAKPQLIEQWYMERFMAFREKARNHPGLYFYQFSEMSDEDAYAYGKNIWDSINAPNLKQNILPYKYRAHLILSKDAQHQIQQVQLRRL
jgi:type I pantothenate kinase